MEKLFTSVLFLVAIALNAQGTDVKRNFYSEIELNTSTEEAWQLLSDVSKWKQWDSHTIDARLTGDFVDKAQGNLVTANAKVVDFDILDLKEGKSYTVRHKLSSGTLYLRRTLTSTASGTKVLAEVWFKGLSMKNFKKYMGNDYTTVLQKELEDFRKLLQN